MRIRDLIPDADALLTRRYWLDRAAIGNGLATEFPLVNVVRRPSDACPSTPAKQFPREHSRRQPATVCC